jgi:hypothetical protein
MTGRKPAWQSMGQPRAAWSKRINASSGGLHPCEAYLVLPSVEGLSNNAAVYHYSIKEHALEKRAVLGGNWDAFINKFPKGTFLLGISAIYWYVMLCKR